IFDVLNDRMVIYGGQHGTTLDDYANHDNAWALSFGGLVAAPAPAPAPLALGPIVPNPVFEGATFEFTLAVPSRARLAIFDVAGRGGGTLVEGERGAGLHRVRWTRAQRRAAGIGAGAYFVELRVLDRRTTRRMVIAE